MKRIACFPFAVSLALCACTGESGSANLAPPVVATGVKTGTPAPAETGHGAEKSLGELTLNDVAFELTLLGDPSSGKECGLRVKPVKGEARDFAKAQLFVWVEDASGEAVSAPDPAKMESGALHFHFLARAGSKPDRVVLRYRVEGKDERGRLPLSGHGHLHEATPHDGVVASFHEVGQSASAGYLELKLHSDKGDLELWLAEDQDFKKALDLPADSKITATLLDCGDKTVELQARNKDQNEDEEGKANMRAGKTNYFIFPGGTGADASWLKGEAFGSLTVLRFERDGKRLESTEFMLKPHSHSAGADH